LSLSFSDTVASVKLVVQVDQLIGRMVHYCSYDSCVCCRKQGRLLDEMVIISNA